MSTAPSSPPHSSPQPQGALPPLLHPPVHLSCPCCTPSPTHSSPTPSTIPSPPYTSPVLLHTAPTHMSPCAPPRTPLASAVALRSILCTHHFKASLGTTVKQSGGSSRLPSEQHSATPTPAAWYRAMQLATALSHHSAVTTGCGF